MEELEVEEEEVEEVVRKILKFSIFNKMLWTIQDLFEARRLFRENLIDIQSYPALTRIFLFGM
jgi:hypothetical protein